MNIQSEIALWDGGSVKDISDIYRRHSLEKCFISKLIVSIGNCSLQKGATWLLKHHLENKNKISDTEVANIFNQLTTLELWESKLHILQCLPFMPIAKSRKRVIELFLRECLIDRNKFVRAWAYNGFYELAMQYPEHKEETMQFFEMAMRDEAPSVKSRIRSIMKKGF